LPWGTGSSSFVGNAKTPGAELSDNHLSGNVAPGIFLRGARSANSGVNAPCFTQLQNNKFFLSRNIYRIEQSGGRLNNRCAII
jgi:hypothetical protein